MTTEQTRRATRLLRIEQLLRQYGKLSVRQLAEHLNYSKRTVQRDLAALESELGVPLINEGRRWGILEGTQHPLSPVRLTLQESRVIFLAMHAFATSTDERDPDGISALEKLSDTLPAPIAAEIQRTIGQLRARPERADYLATLQLVTEAWADSQRLRIRYQSASGNEAHQLELDPYLLRTGANGSSIYVVGWSSRHDSPRVFKVDRILSAERTGARFNPPELDEIVAKLASSWGGVVFGDEQFDVTIDFTANVAARVHETTWHVTQQTEDLPDGGVRLRFVLPSLLEVVPWVLSWGADAIVVGPPQLRKQVTTVTAAAAANYRRC